MTRLMRHAGLLGLAACLTLASLAGVADARIRKPQIEELVESADLIVIGQVESVCLTPPALWRRVAKTVVLATSAVLIAFFLWRKKGPRLAYLVVMSLLVVSLLEVPPGTYGRVAGVSVSSTIKGAPSPGNISIYFDDDFICDVTHFDVRQEYLLFLRELPSGYAMSWYYWGAWTINEGYVQTERMTWHDAAPIAVADVVARIEAIRDAPREKKDEPRTSGTP